MPVNLENRKVPKRNIPIGIVIDCSRSTDTIQDRLNRSIRHLLSQLRNDAELCKQVEIMAIHYNELPTVIADFDRPLSEMADDALDIRKCEGATNTGQALLTAIDKLQVFQLKCEGQRERCSTPLLFLFTDGRPYAGDGAPEYAVKLCEEYYQKAAASIREKEGAKPEMIYFYAAGIQQSNGHCADMEKLAELTSHPDHVMKVSDDEEASNSIKQFCEVIRQAATALSSCTPLDDMFNAFIGLA